MAAMALAFHVRAAICSYLIMRSHEQASPQRVSMQSEIRRRTVEL